jgi:hypothetical protein
MVCSFREIPDRRRKAAGGWDANARHPAGHMMASAVV